MMTFTKVTKEMLTKHVRIAHALWSRDLHVQAERISNATVLTTCEAVSLLLQRPETTRELTSCLLDELIVHVAKE